MDNLPRVRIAHLPTPVEQLPRLSALLGGPQLLVKRDDLTGLAFGGNKTRKLEFLLGEAQSRLSRTLITAGAAQSNHCRQTAAAAARFGLACILVLDGTALEAPSGNLLLDGLLGAEIVWKGKADREEKLQEVAAAAERAGRQPYLIPYGGSNSYGAAAYCLALRELLDQQVDPDWIVFASSSGGTQAGLEVGKRLFGYQGKLLGISVDEPADVLQSGVAALAESTSQLLGEPMQFSPSEVSVSAAYLGQGYGVMGPAEVEAIHLAAGYEGLLLDPVYTGRAVAGLIDLIRKRTFSPGDSVLFWHTGGGPALFAERYREQIASI